MKVQISEGDRESVEELRSLWLEMVDHHRRLTDIDVVDDEDSWAATNAQYLTWLDDGAGILLLARDGNTLVGYLMCHISSTPTRTFALGATRADIDSLVVSDRDRGNGTGSALLSRCRDLLAGKEITQWSIGVAAGNHRAQALYERFGFRPLSIELTAEI